MPTPPAPYKSGEGGVEVGRKTLVSVKQNTICDESETTISDDRTIVYRQSLPHVHLWATQRVLRNAVQDPVKTR